jgi:PTH1 family peptidyl-tRNA hydrolase
MNDSGIAVREAFKNSNIGLSDLYVIHDDLDIPLGTYKIQLGKGPRTHKGLLSIYEKLGTKNFWHVRIGVENRADKTISGEAYTLMPFEPQEQEIVDGVISEVCKKLVI